MILDSSEAVNVREDEINFDAKILCIFCLEEAKFHWIFWVLDLHISKKHIWRQTKLLTDTQRCRPKFLREYFSSAKEEFYSILHFEKFIFLTHGRPTDAFPALSKEKFRTLICPISENSIVMAAEVKNNSPL